VALNISLFEIIHNFRFVFARSMCAVTLITIVVRGIQILSVIRNLPVSFSPLFQIKYELQFLPQGFLIFFNFLISWQGPFLLLLSNI